VSVARGFPAPQRGQLAHFAIVGRVSPIDRIGILTGGGDAPGLNAVFRAVVEAACNSGIACIGLEDSFDGLIEPADGLRDYSDRVIESRCSAG
jgi:6-phosphofructokinase